MPTKLSNQVMWSPLWLHRTELGRHWHAQNILGEGGACQEETSPPLAKWGQQTLCIRLNSVILIEGVSMTQPLLGGGAGGSSSCLVGPAHSSAQFPPAHLTIGARNQTLCNLPCSLRVTFSWRQIAGPPGQSSEVWQGPTKWENRWTEWNAEKHLLQEGPSARET